MMDHDGSVGDDDDANLWKFCSLLVPHDLGDTGLGSAVFRQVLCSAKILLRLEVLTLNEEEFVKSDSGTIHVDLDCQCYYHLFASKVELLKEETEKYKKVNLDKQS